MSEQAVEQGRRDFLKAGAALGGAAAVGLGGAKPATAAAATPATLPLPEYERWDATEIARLIRRGDVKPSEAVEAAAALRHDGDVAVMKAADHGIWQGSSVFDGARMFDGLVPDLAFHCARVNASAEALMVTPTCDPAEMEAIIRDGLKAYGPNDAVYIRPMYWAIDGSDLGIAPKENSTGFAISLEQVAMPEAARVRIGPAEMQFTRVPSGPRLPAR